MHNLIANTTSSKSLVVSQVLENSSHLATCYSADEHPASVPLAVLYGRKDPLQSFSLLGCVDELHDRAGMTDSITEFSSLISRFTVFYGAGGTRKSSIVLKMLTDAIGRGQIEPSKAFYVCMQESIFKIRQVATLAEEYGFNTVAVGERGFHASNLIDNLKAMEYDDHAKGSVVVVDKFSWLEQSMSPSIVKDFRNSILRFTHAGGTFIALERTEDDISIGGQLVKRKPNVIRQADRAYVVDAMDDISRQAMLVCVDRIAPDYEKNQRMFRYDLPLKQTIKGMVDAMVTVGYLDAWFSREMKDDRPTIEFIVQQLREKPMVRWVLVNKITLEFGVDKEQAVSILEKYKGDGDRRYLWSSEKSHRGQEKFSLNGNPILDSLFHLSSAEF